MKVFISYSKEDYKFAKRIYDNLSREGIIAWLDSEDLLPGQHRKNTIRQEIEDSTHFLVLLSSNSISEKGYPQKELKMALDIYDQLPESEIFLIPARIEDFKAMPMELKDIHPVDLFSDYEAGFKKILKVLKPEQNKKQHPRSESENECLKAPDLSETPQPFVGRENDLQKIHEALQQVMNTRKPRFFFIQGDFGVGKTVLTEHFLSEVAAQLPSVLIGRGKCAIETELSGLTPFSHFLNNLAKQKGFGSDKLLEIIREVAPAWINFITGFSEASESRASKHSSFSQENVFVQFTNALARIAKTQPVIVFIDDLHWADGSSLSLLFHLAQYLQNCPVFFISAYRPVEAMETGSNAPLFREIRANMIRQGATESEMRIGIDVAGYVRQKYPLNTFPAELVGYAQKITEGHALFVSQVFSLWEDTGVIVSETNSDGQPVWKMAKTPDEYSAIPKTLSEVLEERIRLMEDNLRDILTCASVEGEDFTAQVIARLKKIEEYEVCESLETLERRYRLVQEQGTKQVCATVADFYRFVHRFFREHIYNQLSKGKRRILHKQMGECLESLYSERSHIAGQLAFHFKEAHEMLKAAQYALMAAQFEQSRYSWVEGEKLCEFSLIFLGELPDNAETMQIRMNIFERLGFGNYYSGNLSDAKEYYSKALSLSQNLEINAEKIADLCDYIAVVCERKGGYEEMLNYINQGKQILNDNSVSFGAIHIELELSWILLQERFGNNNLAMQALHKLLADTDKLIQTPKLEGMKGRIYRVKGIVLWDLSRYMESIVAYQQAISIISRTTTDSIAGILLDIAESYLKLGIIDECLVHIQKGQDIAQKTGDVDLAAYARFLEGEALLRLGKAEEAVNELTEAITIAERIDALWYISYPYATLALSHLALSNIETAYQKVLRGVEYAEKIPYQIIVGYTLDALAQVETAKQDWEAATQHFQRAVDIHQKAGQRNYLARTQRHLAEMLLQKGEKQKAIELLQTAMTTFKELNLAHEIEKTQKVLKKAEVLK